MDYSALVDNLVERGYLQTPRIIAAFRAVDRSGFVPSDEQGMVGADVALPIGEGQTISQPLTVALMLEWLVPEEGEHVMDIGAGSGWVTALLAHIVGGGGGGVYAIERIPDVAAFGQSNIEACGAINADIVEWHQGDGTRGLPDIARRTGGFHAIHVGAAISQNGGVDAVPSAWRGQLRNNGRIVVPIGNSVWKLIKHNGEWDEEEHPGFAFVPLIEDE